MAADSAEFEYDVALSFAGENRTVVERFATLLKAQGLKVFYDTWEQANLWGRDLYQHLDDVYSKKARFCVMFLSAQYAAKAWTNHELKSAQTRAFRENDAYILPVRLDDTDIPGIRPTLGYLDLRRLSVEQVADIAIQKIATAGARGAVAKAGVAEAGKPAQSAGRIGKLRIKKDFSDHERDTYLEEAYEHIAKFFEESLASVQTENVNIVGKFRRVNANHFTATVYKSGKVASACGIRLGGLGGVFNDQIVYSNDPTSTNSMNEGVSAANDGQEMFLKATGMSSIMRGQGQENGRLSPTGAAELFWGILIDPLQR